MELELVEIDLQECYTSLKEILGEVHREDLLDTLFAVRRAAERATPSAGMR